MEVEAKTVGGWWETVRSHKTYLTRTRCWIAGKGRWKKHCMSKWWKNRNWYMEDYGWRNKVWTGRKRKQITVTENNLQWLQRCWVGRLRDLTLFDRMEDVFISNEKYLADDMVLIAGILRFNNFISGRVWWEVWMMEMMRWMSSTTLFIWWVGRFTFGWKLKENIQVQDILYLW